MIKSQRCGIKGRDLERAGFSGIGQPVFEQCSPNPLAMLVACNIQMMDEVVRLPDGNKDTDVCPMLGYPDTFAFGLLCKIIKLKLGGFGPVKGLSSDL